MLRSVILVAALVSTASAFAGCVGDSGGDSLKSGVTDKSPGATTKKDATESEEDETLRIGKRWHFHNYWGTSPVLTLYEGDVDLDLTRTPQVNAPPPRATAGAAEFRLPYASIVPPETGTITVTLTWDPLPVAFDALNVSYRHATGEEFLPAGSVLPGGNVTIPVTLDMTDAPHTSRSAWSFRFTPVANEAGIGVANGTVTALIVAKIGRPIFIDAPHIDHWEGAETVPVVERSWDVNGVKTGLPGPAPAYVGVDLADPTAPVAEQGPVLLEARVTNGSLVPEGAKTVLARLTWSTELPPEVGKPGLAYAEDNSETSGPLEPEADGDTSRLYRLPLVPRMTDSPYGNQSAWRFHVTLDGPAAAAFAGTITLDVWATKDAPATAAFP